MRKPDGYSFRFIRVRKRRLKICFYAPFKPLDHEHPSGDLVIGSGLFAFLSGQGHSVRVASDFRSRWIYWQPWRWFSMLRAYLRVTRRFSSQPADLWLSYHTYYKAPDILGPLLSDRLRIPYVIFQGMYSTKRRKSIATWPGYVLNRKALCSARYVFTNRYEDRMNLERLLPGNRVGYVAPGIQPEKFLFDEKARIAVRKEWQVADVPVVLSAAMFRPGVKTRGIEWVIRACGRLFQRGNPLYLVIAGDGKEALGLRSLGEKYLPGRVRFVGKVPREKMYRFYSGGDIFVFPGIRESLGMVYLEAQSCGMPVVAFENGGIPEVVRNGETGFLTPPLAVEPFLGAVETLLKEKTLRRRMGDAARFHVAQNHHLEKNYRIVEETLERIIRPHH